MQQKRQEIGALAKKYKWKMREKNMRHSVPDENAGNFAM